MDYIIGVDAGGTKTEAVAYDLKGNALSMGYSGFGNMLIDVKKAIEHITTAIKECQKALNPTKCCYIYLGVAGIESGMHRDELKKALGPFQAPFDIVSDARIAHAALLQGGDGILTISGTGSVSYALKDGRMEMSGGWGHLLGDEGSGYWIVIEAFKRMIQDFDEMNPISNLSSSLMKELKISSAREIKSFIYSVSKGEVAALAPVIVREAEAGNKEAQSILSEAGSCLGEMTLCLYRKLAFESGVAIALKGSILTHIESVREAFIDTITAEVDEVIFICDDISATKGAFYLGLEKLKLDRGI